MNNLPQLDELRVGDLVYYKDYFCEIVSIMPSTRNSSSDILHLVRKFRQNGSYIKSVWKGNIPRGWVTRPDYHFTRMISYYDRLLNAYINIKNNTNGQASSI